jgi:hypothetical protein
MQEPFMIPLGSAQNRYCGCESGLWTTVENILPTKSAASFLGQFCSPSIPRCEVVRASKENLAMIRQTLKQLAQGTPISAPAE